MKLTGLHLENWLCHRRLDARITPLTICAGPNARGKSALADGIAFAMLAELRRVRAKSERAKLVTQGADRGSVRLTFGDIEIVRDIETGKLTKSNRMPTAAASVEMLPACLDAAYFARMTIDARRVALLNMMDVRIDTASIHAELVKRDRRVAMLGSCFVHGVPIEKWHEEAVKKLQEARGAWKQITGEAYGSRKAEDWQAAAPEQAWSRELFEAAKARRAQAEVEIGLLQRTLGRIEQAEHEHAPNQVAHRARLETQAARFTAATETLAQRRREVGEHQDRLNEAEAELADVRSRQPGAEPDLCPHCGKGVVRRDGVLEPHVPHENPATPAHLAIAKEKHRATSLKAQSAHALVLTAEVDLERAEIAKNALAQLDAGTGTLDLDAPPPALPVRADIEADIQRHTDARASAEADVATLERAKTAGETAANTTKIAADKHGQIQAWVQIVDDLAPAGIQQTLIGKALDPLNDSLRDLSARFKWPQPRIGQDMEIAIDGTDYELHAESEKWRADTLIAIAIAARTQLRIVVLDRFDVMEIPARQAAMGSLYALTRPDGMLDTCILIGTLKAPPMVPGDVSLIWLGEPATVQVAA